MAGYQPFNADGGNTGGESGNADESGNAGEIGTVAGFLGGIGGNSGDVERDVNGDEFDPDIHAGRDKRNADGSWRKKRGRRSSGGNSQRKAGSRSNSQASVEALTRALAIVHLGIATATKTPELILEENEAETLAAATANVLEEFDIKPNPKVEAIFGLVVAAGSIYGPKVYFIQQRRKGEQASEE